MIPIYTPQTESEVAVISSMLDAYEIPYYIRGGAFSKLYPGLQIKDYNMQTFMVPDEFEAVAQELLNDFINPKPQEAAVKTKFSITRVFRVLMEITLMGWVFTGERWNKNKSEDSHSSDG
jgi:hypothetical protein